MVKLHAFGDSFIVGDQDDFLEEIPKNIKPVHNMKYDDRVEYLKYNVSFVSIIAKHLNLELINYAVRGSGNYPQLDKLWLNLLSGNIKENDIVLFGFTTSGRDRIQAMFCEKVVDHHYGESIIDRKLLKEGPSSTIFETDHFYVLSILEMLSKKFNVRIIKFNLFDNALDYSNDNIKRLYDFTDFIGYNIKGNTLIDIINDTWGQGIKNPQHTLLDIPEGYEKYYSRLKHPSIEGHKKIADWFLQHVKI